MTDVFAKVLLKQFVISKHSPYYRIIFFKDTKMIRKLVSIELEYVIRQLQSQMNCHDFQIG